MNCSSTETRKIAHSKALHTIVFVMAMISFMLNGLNVQAADFRPAEYRVTAADDKFADTWQFAVAYRLRPPRRIRAQHLELAVGTFSTSQETGETS